jgi:hypothetical protein
MRRCGQAAGYIRVFNPCPPSDLEFQVSDLIFGSSTFLVGKSTIVAERHRKLARHNVPGKASDTTMRPERTLGTIPIPAFPPSLAGRISPGYQPGTLSLANFQGRLATARMLKKSPVFHPLAVCAKAPLKRAQSKRSTHSPTLFNLNTSTNSFH